MAHETWRDVVDYEGFYQVSNLGRVRSLNRVVTSKIGVKRVFNGQILVQSTNNKNGYRQVGLRKNGRELTKRVHRLVADAFIDNPNGYTDIDHINCDKTDNRVENLEWVSHYENMRRAYDNRLIDKDKARERFRSKKMRNLVDESHKVAVIRDDGVKYRSMKEAAAAIGCHPSSIGKQINGKIGSIFGHTFTRI